MSVLPLLQHRYDRSETGPRHLVGSARARAWTHQRTVDAHALVRALEDGNPRLFVFEPTGPTAAPNSIIVNPHTLQPGEERIVADTLAGALRQRMLPRVATAAG